MYSISGKWFHKRKDMYTDIYAEALYTMTDTYRKIALLDLKTGISHHVMADCEELEYLKFLGMNEDGEIPYDKWMHRILKELIHPDYKEEFRALFNLESLRKGVHGGKSRQTLVYQCRSRVGGEYHWVQAEYVPRRSKELSEEILYYIRDINDRWIAAERKRKELERAFQRADRENRRKMDFLESLSEDLRKSVSAIYNMNQAALRMMDQGQPDAGRHYLAMTSNVAAYLLPLLTNLVDISHLQKKGAVLNYECFDMYHLIRSCHEYCYELAQGRHISLVWTGEIRGFYLGDAERIRLVLVNVMENAVKFNHSGGMVKISLEMIRGMGATDIFMIHVSDSGAGISEEQKKYLFEPFHRDVHKRVDIQPGLSLRQGWGIGLSVAKSILDAMGGSICIESESGVGTEVTIRFALQRAQGAVVSSRISCQAVMARQ